MKKILLALLATISISAGAVVVYPVPGLGILGSFAGTWESTATYSVQQIKGTYYNAAPIVVDSVGTFIMSNESFNVTGMRPESQPVTWTKI